MSFETRHPTLLAVLGMTVVVSWAALFAFWQRHQHRPGSAPLQSDGVYVLSAPDGIPTPYRLIEPASGAPSPVLPEASALHGGLVVWVDGHSYEVTEALDGALALWPVRGALPAWAILQFRAPGAGRASSEDVALLPAGDHLAGRSLGFDPGLRAVLVVGSGTLAHSTPSFALVASGADAGLGR